MTRRRVRHEFVEFIPEELDEGVIYISMPYATAVHKCLCGCGREIALPLSPVGWRLTYDGESISLYPSIGNWDLPCRSHYWIWGSAVHWAKSWPRRDVEAGKARDRQLRRMHFDPGRHPPSTEGAPEAEGRRRRSRLRDKLLRKKA
jgi:Family of unknown function (DUF6527)